MHRPNYRAWELNPTDFSALTTREQHTQFILRYAVLAPSSHNTQPWRFRVVDDGQSIEILPDFSRALPCSDPHNRQLYLSIGCALGNLLVAAAAFGFATTVSYHLGTTAREPLVRVNVQQRNSLSSSALQEYPALLPFITQRRMNRAPYDVFRRVDQKILRALQALNDEKAVTVSLIEKGSSLFDPFLDLVFQSTLATQGNPGIIEEWARWFRSPDTYASDGVPPFDFLVPDSVVSVAEQAQGTKALFATAPVFLVLGASVDDPEHWVRTGKVLAFLSLAAEKLGVSQAPWGAIVEDAASAQRASQLLGIDYTLYFSRLGYADATPHHSPRRSLEEVLHYA